VFHFNSHLAIKTATINGSIEIGRAPGTVTVTFLAPAEALKVAGLYELVKEQYNLLD
jgi:hypothetical protein